MHYPLRWPVTAASRARSTLLERLAKATALTRRPGSTISTFSGNRLQRARKPPGTAVVPPKRDETAPLRKIFKMLLK